jgi:5-methylcytosine-specific restriction endonuclease McrA
VASSGRQKNGRRKWKKICSMCRDTKDKPYRLQKGSICEICGFIPVHSCQLDVDHMDGDKSNDNPSNLQTLCANCHRLKTVMNRDWEQTKIVELKLITKTGALF